MAGTDYGVTGLRAKSDAKLSPKSPLPGFIMGSPCSRLARLTLACRLTSSYLGLRFVRMGRQAEAWPAVSKARLGLLARFGHLSSSPLVGWGRTVLQKPR